eukprot:GEMP01043238.1.p1 GENE.GEMP01043238.1~~GEMP01043238.1.p1  ORF type:complete len:187 (+),score=34.27 GEMP01043238.1:685-1245(+)
MAVKILIAEEAENNCNTDPRGKSEYKYKRSASAATLEHLQNTQTNAGCVRKAANTRAKKTAATLSNISNSNTRKSDTMIQPQKSKARMVEYVHAGTHPTTPLVPRYPHAGSREPEAQQPPNAAWRKTAALKEATAHGNGGASNATKLRATLEFELGTMGLSRMLRLVEAGLVQHAGVQELVESTKK